MQNIGFLALILWELLKKKGESYINKILAIFQRFLSSKTKIQKSGS